MKTDQQRREELFARMRTMEMAWGQLAQLYLVLMRDVALVALVTVGMFSALDAFCLPLSMQDWLAQFVIVLPVTWWLSTRLSATVLDRTEALVQRWERR